MRLMTTLMIGMGGQMVSYCYIRRPGQVIVACVATAAVVVMGTGMTIAQVPAFLRRRQVVRAGIYGYIFVDRV